jgi:catechol 2,3-dioxygenase-like lactoylglutathione lyase family enzyme
VPIATTPDHVAIAVPSIEAAAARWREELGGRWVGPPFPMPGAGFQTRQLRFAGGAKLELLEPLHEDGFAARFLERYGARIHHVTLKVPALLPALATLEADGLEAVDVFAEGDLWHEAFLRPRQIGGLLVQIAWSGRSDEEWAELVGGGAEAPDPGAATLCGPTLRHPDLDAAARVWSTLGAEVVRDGATLRVTWADAPLDLVVEEGEPAGPRELRLAGGPALPTDPGCFGPATVATDRAG